MIQNNCEYVIQVPGHQNINSGQTGSPSMKFKFLMCEGMFQLNKFNFSILIFKFKNLNIRSFLKNDLFISNLA